MVASTFPPGNSPPSPGFAPCETLICNSSALVRYQLVTPKRPEAICLIAERLESPFSMTVKRDASSPPSPVLDLPPRRFIAIANASWLSAEMEPKLMAPVTKRLTISFAGSTSSSGIAPPFTPSLNLNKPRKVARRVESSSETLANCLYASLLLVRAAS